MDDSKQLTRAPYDDIEFSDDRRYFYEGRLFTGVGVELTKGGVLRSEIEFLNGLQHGWARGYYLNGQISVEIPYDNGLRDGVEKKWFENGRHRLENRFERDVLLSSRRWSEDGCLEDEFVRPEDDVLFECLARHG